MVKRLLSTKSKGSSPGMPILAVVGVLCTLAGIGIIFNVTQGLGTKTAEDHDHRELVDLGNAINNKCLDVSGESSTTSVTGITVDFELRNSESLEKEDGELKLQTADGPVSYGIHTDTCDINLLNDSIDIGTYTMSVTYEDGTENPPVINVEAS